MLTIYRRHSEDCPQASDRISRKCRCPLWATGTLEGKPYRKTLKTRSWERAEQLKREVENGKKPKAEPLTFRKASESFLTELQSQNRAPDTIRKYALLFRQLASFGIYLTEFTFDTLLRFRAGWREEGAATKNKKLDRLKAFFRFCHEAGWIGTNPAKRIKAASARAALVKKSTFHPSCS